MRLIRRNESSGAVRAAHLRDRLVVGVQLREPFAFDISRNAVELLIFSAVQFLERIAQRLHVGVVLGCDARVAERVTDRSEGARHHPDRVIEALDRHRLSGVPGIAIAADAGIVAQLAAGGRESRIDIHRGRDRRSDEIAHDRARKAHRARPSDDLGLRRGSAARRRRRHGAGCR